MRYAVMILGCKVNDYEAHSLKESLDKDYLEVNFKDEADIYIIFSCCVTNIAESKTRKFIHSAKRRNPKAYIVVVGCYAQTKKDDEVFKEVDLVVGSKYKDQIKTFIDQKRKESLVEDLTDVSFENLLITKYKNKTRAFLKVQDGCDQYCSYCIIPYARGNLRSAKYDFVIDEAHKLSKTSKEIVLVGIHTGRYKDGNHNLDDLLIKLNEIEGLYNIRLSSIEITEITDGIIKLLKNGKLAPHLHIPLQAGSNHILKLMNRPYTKEEFKKRLAYIRECIPGISISTDLIVGFPNESEEDFKETLDFLKDIKFSFIHVFPYSRKKGTKADLMNNHLSGDVKKARVNQVDVIQKPISEAYYQSFVGKTINILAERVKQSKTYGYSRHYALVEVDGKYEANSILTVKVNESEGMLLKGEVIDVFK